MTPINPATGAALEDRSPVSLLKAEDAASRVRRAADDWGREPLSTRANLLKSVARLLEERADSCARLMAEEMGKPVGDGRSEIEKCARVCDYYAEHGARFLSPEPIHTEAKKSYVAFEPLGTVLAIMPWNFPFWQVFRFAAPALMAGNTALLKHASNVQGCGEAIETVLRDADGPADLLLNVFISNDDTESLIENEAIAAVTLTGSTRAGRAVAARAGRALKKAVLELGGSDAYVILSDADLDVAVTACVSSRLVNNGQSCIAAKRFVVAKAHREEVEKLVVEQMKQKRVGDPCDPETELGPMARIDLRDELHQQVQKSIEHGATLLLGGAVPEKPGAWYPPTVLTGVKSGMAAYEEELFGPVASIIEAENDEDALRIANDSDFGLGAAVFSKDDERAERMARRIEAGAVYVNDFVRSDPRLPFGGVKRSGYGRELSSFGIREFVNIKTVYVA